MLRCVSLIVIPVLFLLSLLTWVYVPYLIAWELSVITTELGHWFALATLAIAGGLCLPNLTKTPRQHVIDSVLVGLAMITVVSFLSPLAAALRDFPGEVSFTKLLFFHPAPSFQRTTFLAANDQTPLNLDFYPAKVDAGSPASPWILVIHGGGWINGSSEQVPELNADLNELGYSVISVDYRLSPGWLWPAPRDDVFRALKFIRARAAEWKLDPDRWAILGRSAGAQIAGVVAYSLKGREAPKGFISFYDPTDLVFGYGLGQEDDILRSRTLLRGFLGGPPAEAKALYETASVMRAATSESCPTLLIHGKRDNIVSYRHSERLLATLRDENVDVRFVSLRFGPHGFDYFFSGPEAQVSTFEIENFLRRVLPSSKAGET